jgi:hypothetical protein
MLDKYPIRDEPGKTMFVFEKNGKVYGHIVKDRTNKAPAKFIFETKKFNSIDELKTEFPELIVNV